MNTRLVVTVTLASCSCAIPTHVLAGEQAPGFPVADEARNIVYVVPDGMGLANVTASRIFLNGPDGAPLYMETLPQIGYQRTHSANSTVTDSAAAASAWSCGDKFENGEICFHVTDWDTAPPTGHFPPTSLELARNSGKATGLVATSTITHATPASYGAHVWSRNCENEIARQFVADTNVDVLLGGGVATFTGADGSSATESLSKKCLAPVDAIELAESAGYTVVYTADAMDDTLDGLPNQKTSAAPMKLLGLFAAGGLTPEYVRPPDSTEPDLATMTEAALSILEKDRDGFFLVVECSQVDWANHANDYLYQLGEMIACDTAAKVVLDWASASKRRMAETLLIVVPDHETGGFAINGPYGSLSEAGDIIEDAWTSGSHTAVDTLIWSRGPGSEYLGAAIDNTDLYEVVNCAGGYLECDEAEKD
jgi:alkaline phosphatase